MVSSKRCRRPVFHAVLSDYIPRMLDKGTKRAIVIALGAIVLGGYLYHIAAYWPQINDEAFITFRYSRMLAEGHGPYFNPAEHVEGYTNFLMMLLMAGAIALFGPDDVLFLAKLVGAAGGLAVIVAAWLLCSRWLATIERLRPFAPIYASTAGALVATNAAFAVNSTSGLETTEYAALVLWGLCLLQFETERQRFLGSAIAFALATLSRPEGILVFAAVWVARLIRGDAKGGWRPLLIDAGIVVAALALQLGFRLAFYEGRWLPPAVLAGLHGTAAQAGALGYLVSFARLHLGMWLALLCIFPFLFGDPRLRRDTLPSLFVMAAAVIALFGAPPDSTMGYRLLVPYAPLWAGLAVMGIALIADRSPLPRVPLTVAAGIALIAFIAFWQNDVRRVYAARTIVRAQGFATGHRALAMWLNAMSNAGQAVALRDIGLIGYNCPQLRILDLSGVSDPVVTHAAGGYLANQIDPEYVLDQKPAFIVIVNRAPMMFAGSPPTEITPAVLARARLDPSLLERSGLEERLVQAERFGRYYHRPTPPRDDTAFEQLRSMLGAEELFSHLHPDAFYFLAVYRYGEPAPPLASQPAAVTTTQSAEP